MTTTSAAPEQTTAPAGSVPDPRPSFATALELCRQVVAGVRPDQLDDPTPCTELDVRTLGHHVLAVLERIAVIGAGGDPNDSPVYAPGVGDDQWLTVFDTRAAQVATVWSDDAVLTNVVTVPWAKLPGAIALLIYINELSVHTWDLATATGQRPLWDDAVLATAHAAIQRGLPAEGRDNPELPFGEVVEVGSDASPIERLVAWNGRDPYRAG
jgi:uncharacterized protein (TIGR03086 family)